MPQSQGHRILNGNELIVQGGLEAGFSLYTGYPGSPLADYFNILYKKHDKLQKKGIKVVLANSEANAAAMASGAKQAGRNCLVAMKSMGLHVAADALSVGQFANPFPINEKGEYPGTVIVVGDDPWSISTSTPADSRYLYKHLHIPFLEPSTPQELKDWMKWALEISKKSSIYQGLLLTTFMAEGGGRVEIFEEAIVEKEKITLDTQSFDLSKNVMVPPNSLLADTSMINDRFPKVIEAYKEFKLDRIFGADETKTGFISTGAVFETLKQVLDEANYLEHFSLYKLASSYPLVDDFLVPWLEKLDHLIIVEEKRGFLETELIELIQRNNLKIKIMGKNFNKLTGFPAHGGLNYEIIRDKIIEAFKTLQIVGNEFAIYDGATLNINTPRRLPTFCPGCPHRETLSLLKDLRKNLMDKNIDLVSHGDVGCYSLSFLEPFKEMHNLSAMGQGGALGAGVDFFTTNPSVVLMGDSTFFHSGLTDISNSVQAEHTITYIILDNDNTAMTGHQMTPRTGLSVEGHQRPRQDMLNLVKNLGVSEAYEINPSDRYFYQNKLNSLVLKKGVKVIVSNKECGLTFHGRQKAIDRKLLADGKVLPVKEFYQINTSVCEDCRECVESTGCPGLTQSFDAYGTKVAIDPQICVADSYCTKIKACPSFELVKVYDYHPTQYKPKKEKGQNVWNIVIPEPDRTKTLEHIRQGNDWRVVVTGVGGSGVTTISRVLAEAASNIGTTNEFDFKFVDQKGLAQRNGTVTGHLNLFLKGKSYGTVTPIGTADLILSPDLLNGPQALQYLAKHGKGIFDNEFQVPLSILMDRGEEQEPLDEITLREQIHADFGDQINLASFKSLSFQEFGRSVYASAMLLGYAYQAGCIPFNDEELKNAFFASVPRSEFENNWDAFLIGRKVYLEGDEAFLDNTEKGRGFYLKMFEKSISSSTLLPLKKTILFKKFADATNKLIDYFPKYDANHLAQFVHDLIVFDHGKNLNDFLNEAKLIPQFYPSFKLQKIALSTLVKTYWLKDEVFVAHLMTTPIQNYKNDQLYKDIGYKYKVTHINRPQFNVLGFNLEFDINPKDWMLGLMKHLRILRKILPAWHQKERTINRKIRQKILENVHLLEEEKQRAELQKLANIKGYREVKYKIAGDRLEN